MNNLKVVSRSNITDVEFDDQQKASVAAALQALADQMTPAVVTQPTTEIIELLDSDAEDSNNSDCEIMGFLIDNQISDFNERNELNLSTFKPFVKKEIKEEIDVPEPEIRTQEVGGFVVSIRDEQRKTLSWNETSFVNEAITNNENQPLAVGEKIQNFAQGSLEVISEEILNEPQNEYNGNIDLRPTCNDVQVESVMLNMSNNSHINQPQNIPTYVTMTDITKDELQVKEVNLNAVPLLPPIDLSEETLSAFSEDVITSFKKEPNVFQSDLREIGDDCNDESNIIDLLDDDDGDEDYFPDDNDGNEDSEDEETKKIVIDLLESDEENENTEVNGSASYEKTIREGFACFIHYICPQCGEMCGKFSNFKAHTEGQHDMGSIAALNLRTIIDKAGDFCYQCIECNQKLRLKTLYHKLQAHRIKHLPHNDYFKCRLCDSRFNERSKIRHHLRSAHIKIFRQYIKKKGPHPALKYVKIKCPICRRVLKDRQKWWKHLEDAHDYVDKMKSHVTKTSDNVYLCNLCKENNVERKLREYSIKNHILTHEKYKSFECNACDQFKSIDIIRCFAHVRTEHLNEKKVYSCTYCDDIFDSTRARISHYKDVHKYTVHKCAVCQKEYFSASSLMTHMNYKNHFKLK